jgi:hypothetical protein
MGRKNKDIRKALINESFSDVCGFYKYSIKDETCANIKYPIILYFFQIKRRQNKKLPWVQ